MCLRHASHASRSSTRDAPYLVRHSVGRQLAGRIQVALIEKFEKISRERPRVQPTKTVCVYSTFVVEGMKLLQLDTAGAAGRKLRGKVSQTIQLDETRARELAAIIADAFPVSRR